MSTSDVGEPEREEFWECLLEQHYRSSNSSGDTTSASTSTGSSCSGDPPITRFNRLLVRSVARHWNQFCANRLIPAAVVRGRSISDVGISDIASAHGDSTLALSPSCTRGRGRGPGRGRGRLRSCSHTHIPILRITAAAATDADHTDASSDAERRTPRPLVPRSTGNFVGAGGGASGGGGGSSSCSPGVAGAPRSAPATPLQTDPPPRHQPQTPNTKPDKNAVKQLSNSVPSVRVAGLGSGGGGAGSGDSGESKAPSKGRQKKFLRNFPQVGPDERVLNYYSCALVGDILLQGHLYITKNYFAFYSNVFGYVTKLLIPTVSVLRVSKEKMARIIPNAVGVCTRDERHVFGSLLSRDSTYKLMLHVWKAASVPEFIAPVPTEELRISEVELDASEYSPEDESSSGGGESTLHPRCTRRVRPTTPPRSPHREDSIIASVKSAAVIQPTLLLGAAAPEMRGAGRGSSVASVFLILLAVCLAASALVLGRNLYLQRTGLTIPTQSELMRLRSADLYGELLAWQARLHSQAATEVHGFLTTNLHLLAKVRQSLEALSTMILADVDKHAVHADMPNLHSTNPPESGVS